MYVFGIFIMKSPKPFAGAFLELKILCYTLQVLCKLTLLIQGAHVSLILHPVVQF